MSLAQSFQSDRKQTCQGEQYEPLHDSVGVIYEVRNGLSDRVISDINDPDLWLSAGAFQLNFLSSLLETATKFVAVITTASQPPLGLFDCTGVARNNPTLISTLTWLSGHCRVYGNDGADAVDGAIHQMEFPSMISNTGANELPGSPRPFS